MDSKELTVAQLERMLAGRRSKLEVYTSKRDKLAKQLAIVEEKINRLQGTPSATGGGMKVRRARKKTGTRPQNEKSLKVLVEEMLKGNKKGMRLEEITKKVLDTGYQTTSSNFKNTLYQTMYGLLKKGVLVQEDGLYRMA